MDTKKITLTYLNIRQSISILLIKLTLIDLLAASLILGFYLALLEGTIFVDIAFNNPLIFFVIFGTIGLLKVALTSYIILLWLNEYYEITPDSIVHKSGIIFKKKERYDLEKVRAMNVDDSIIGEMLNFATITLYDLRMQRYLDMYMIHDPKRYIKVLEILRPNIETKSDETIIPVIGQRDE